MSPVKELFRRAHIRWCHPLRDPRKKVTILPISKILQEENILIERVGRVLLNQGTKNLLGSVQENLKMLVPIFLKELEGMHNPEEDTDDLQEL